MTSVGLKIVQCSIIEIECAHNFETLVDEYAAESAIEGMPHPAHKITLYKLMESSDAIFPIAAYYNGDLIGFCAVLCPVIPHYGVTVAVTESLFVAKDKRKTGAGLKLIAKAQAVADEKNSPGLLISAVAGSDLVEVLPQIGFVKTNEVFFRKRANA